MPGADDLVPVLVFVIVKANPPSLLSTIQFVDTFEKVILNKIKAALSFRCDTHIQSKTKRFILQ